MPFKQPLNDVRFALPGGETKTYCSDLNALIRSKYESTVTAGVRPYFGRTVFKRQQPAGIGERKPEKPLIQN